MTGRPAGSTGAPAERERPDGTPDGTGWDAGRDIRDRSRQVGRALRNRAGDDSAGQSGSDGEDGGLHFG